MREGEEMKANLDDATHYQERHDEHWLLYDGVYHLYVEGYWQVAKPDFNGLKPI